MNKHKIKDLEIKGENNDPTDAALRKGNQDIWMYRL